MNYLSVCSGIEAATTAWHPLGWNPVAFSEIEPFPSALLAHRFPEVPNLGDMTKYQEWNFGKSVELLVGGTPCQAFSVAGLRKGLADPRGNLALVYLGIADKFKPRWIVWENVPGVLSSNGGRDFGAFLGALGELGYGFAYRVLDAQFFGVAQRRRRVFVVGYLGDWRPAAAVLFESESVRGYPTPSRKERQGPPGRSEVRPALYGGNNRSGPVDLATACNAKGGSGRMDFESEVFAVYDMRGNGDGGTCPTITGDHAGRPTDYTPVVLPVHTTGAGFWKEGFGTLRAREQDSHENLVTFPVLMDQGGGVMSVEDDMVGTLRRETHGHEPVIPVADTITASYWKNHGASGGKDCEPRNHISCGFAVRRLTPRECERLQGFPDSWTQIPWRKKSAEDCPDGPRYKAIGNSMAVPVMAWIGNRIQQAEEAL